MNACKHEWSIFAGGVYCDRCQQFADAREVFARLVASERELAEARAESWSWMQAHATAHADGFAAGLREAAEVVQRYRIEVWERDIACDPKLDALDETQRRIARLLALAPPAAETVGHTITATSADGRAASPYYASRATRHYNHYTPGRSDDFERELARQAGLAKPLDACAPLPERMFPIMSDSTVASNGFQMTSVPFRIVDAHRAQCRFNHGGQTPDRLAERGGLSPRELLAVLTDSPWKEVRPLSIPEMVARLKEAIASALTGSKDGDG